MTVRDAALVAFTLLMQTSVGILLVVTAVHPSARDAAHGSARPFDLPLLVAAVAAGLGLLASLAHLGQPLQAWLAVTNVRTSWLSREIALAALFTAVLVVLVLLSRAHAHSGLASALAGFAVVIGTCAIYAMSRTYMIPAQPAWNRVMTPATFFATALALGILVVLVTLGSPGAGADGSASRATAPFVRVLPLVAIGCLALQLLLLPAQAGGFAVEPAAAISAGGAGHLAIWLSAARAVFAIAAALILLGSALRATPAPLPAAVTSLALFFACLSEVFGRVLFYASSVRI